MFDLNDLGRNAELGQTETPAVWLQALAHYGEEDCRGLDTYRT